MAFTDTNQSQEDMLTHPTFQNLLGGTLSPVCYLLPIFFISRETVTLVTISFNYHQD